MSMIGINGQQVARAGKLEVAYSNRHAANAARAIAFDTMNVVRTALN